MQFKRTKFPTVRWRQHPDPAAPELAPTLSDNQRLLPVDEAADPNGDAWTQVEVVVPGQDPRRGWVKSSLIEADDFSDLGQLPTDIEPVRYMSILTIAARRFQTNRDYLALLAQVESGIRNVASTSGSNAQGPFQFIPDTWNRLVDQDNAGPDPVGVTHAGIGSPVDQAFMAARMVAGNTKALLDQFDRLPTGAELYATHFFGLPAGQAVIAASQTNAAAKIDAVLRDFYRGTQVGEAFAAKVMGFNPDLLAPGGIPRSVAEVMEAFAKKLEDAADAVAPHIAALAPDLRFPAEAPAGEPPWMPVARAEEQAGVQEVQGAGSNPRIVEYHASTGQAAPDDTPWCASFVSFCMANSGDPKVEQANLKNKLAASWMQWGEAVTDPPVGALVVTHPLVPDASGHVGFFVGFVDASRKRVKLLGGNQGDRVCIQDYDATQVRAYRWLP